LRRDLENGIVGKEDFIKALTKVKPRVTKELVDYYKNFE
jgi:SpoVK/Ycf46/Vps4 family AAA+-type ATPase